MDNTFNISRFGKYFVFDLKSRWKEHRIYMLFYALFPFLIYVTSILFGIIGNGFASTFSGVDPVRPELPLRIIAFTMMTGLFLITFPSRTYGFITDKAKGSNWTLLPASRLEKFLSMMLISLVIIPAAFLFVYLLGDSALCLIDKECGKSVFSAWMDRTSNGVMQLDMDSPLTLGTNGLWIMVSGVLQTVSVFLLGALVFKKRKVLGTAFSLFGIMLVLTTILSVIINNCDFSNASSAAESWLYKHIDHLDTIFNFWGNLELAVVVIGCGLLSWLRIKKIQY